MRQDLRLDDLKMFLRARRESLDPQSAGLPLSGRRRTKGLRREEVAVLSGVSATWYTWLEQGRPVKASLATMKRIARTLRLSPVDEAYLLTLAGFAPMAPADPPDDVVTGYIRDFMDGLAIPCFITGPILEVVAYNALANAIYEFDAYEGPFADSHIWRLFRDPVRQSLYGDMLPEIELRTAGVFRTRYAEFSGSPRFDALLTALLDSSPRFAHCWSHGHTAPLDTIVMKLAHRRLGPLNLATVRFAMIPISGHLMITMPAADPATQRTFERLGAKRETPGTA
jgi:transcriptional regulator with XRE-family HTH domain